MSRCPHAYAPVPKECGELRSSRLGRDTAFQPPDQVQDMRGPDLTRHRMHADRQPDLGTTVRKVDTGRHDADDFMRPAIDDDAAAHHWLPPPPRPPEPRRKKRQ